MKGDRRRIKGIRKGPYGQKCVRYKLVYSKVLGKKIKRCAEFE